MIIRIVICCAAALFFSSCVQQTFEENADIESMAKYLLGSMLLQHDRGISRFDQRAVRMEQLQSVTGVDGDGIITYLRSCKNRPEKAIELFEEIQRLCDNNTEKAFTKQ